MGRTLRPSGNYHQTGPAGAVYNHNNDSADHNNDSTDPNNNLHQGGL